MLVSCANPNCRSALQLAEKFAGQRIWCPACRQILEVPVTLFGRQEIPQVVAAVPAAQDDTPLALSASCVVEEAPPPAKPTADSGRCPSCNAQFAAGALVCVQCGYHLEKGKTPSPVSAGEETAATANIKLAGTKAVGFIAIFFGGSMLLIALLLLFGQSWFAIVPFLFGAGSLVIGVLFLITAVTKVRISKREGEDVLCTFTYQALSVPYYQGHIYLTKGDEFVLRNETPVYGLVILLILICSGVVPGILWWYILLRKHTLLRVENPQSAKVQPFAIFWDEDAVTHLVDLIRDVEYVPLERK